MSSLSHITKHARIRLKERTKLTVDQLADILDRQCFVNTGRMPGFFKDHLLFYSIPDDDFFIGLQDVTDGTVVTVLPLDYHKNLAWDVSEEQKIQAKELMLTTASKVISTPEVTLPEVIHVRVHFIDPERGYQRCKIIDKKRAEDYDHKPQRILTDKKFLKEIPWLVKDINVDIKTVFAISVKMGQHSNPLIRDIDPAMFGENK